MTMLQTASAPWVAMPLPELYRRVERHIPPFEWQILADDIAADIVGDSLALAREAVRTDADVIVLAGVHFMAETAKLLNPEKIVLIPDMRAGCSLADSSRQMTSRCCAR